MHLVKFLKSYIIHWQVPEPDWDVQSSIFSQWWTAKMMSKKKALVVITIHKYSHSPSLKLAKAVQPAMVKRVVSTSSMFHFWKEAFKTNVQFVMFPLPSHGDQLYSTWWRVCQPRFLNEKDTAQRSLQRESGMLAGTINTALSSYVAKIREGSGLLTAA